MLRIDQIRISIHDNQVELKNKILKILHIDETEMLEYSIHRKNVDARQQPIFFIYSVNVEVKDEKRILRKKIKNVRSIANVQYSYPNSGIIEMKHRPIIVGFGPAGMFCALTLAKCGYRPIVFEQGSAVEQRVKDVDEFIRTGTLNEWSNIQFGEGGAGTFSDGKLTARTKDLRVHKIYEEFVAYGAPEEILYEAYPHIGSDKLIEVVRNVREAIIEFGGEIHFNCKVEELISHNDRVCGVVTDNKKYESDVVVLALGNSARDSFIKFYDQGLQMEAKPFAVGLRIEHPQKSINEALYHSEWNNPSLPIASYRLQHQWEGKGVYTFCMCPGGEVVAATSRRGHVVVNGMSNYARDKQNANAAILVQVDQTDYGIDTFSGMQFQERLEKDAFILGGENYKAPAQKVYDFLGNEPSNQEVIQPSYPLGVTYIDFHHLFSPKICAALQQGIKDFQKKNKAFRNENAVLTGVETRSSSPLRIIRDKEMQSISLAKVYPIGEGSGYSGGIVSSAIDGLKCAEKIIEIYDNQRVL
ncbi:putative FAD-dependent dehydrogenase [Breznakia sp. PF5-3]|uniref:NAD(P)/FAD-dependent oxidoreductase n=1 Tax=unclassified Breznakia TaxID=2623764 RepID=UPI0024056677|nr:MULTISPECIES: hypothetical protein [unclassified Breznakia]MDF9824601.1 putative FAD-dependent dehydrogenase [Breznakia sp. PM6-1]MDF9835537.1 putative FAD-dependent dehydrogenase [Breznakia sp. PF5-3]